MNARGTPRDNQLFLAVTFLGCLWLLLTIVGQISVKTLTYLRRFDPLGLLPLWYFFAPNPVRYDSVLLIRPISGSVPKASQWEVAKILYDERWYHFVFNTSRRLQKTIHDLQTAIGNLSDNFPNEAIAKSSPAMAITGYVRKCFFSKNGIEEPAGAFQWCIVRVVASRTSPTSRVVYVSDICPSN